MTDANINIRTKAAFIEKSFANITKKYLSKQTKYPILPRLPLGRCKKIQSGSIAKNHLSLSQLSPISSVFISVLVLLVFIVGVPINPDQVLTWAPKQCGTYEKL
jgi:hypothetical protein